MIGQSLGSVYLSWEALCKLTPLTYFDTSGYAFTYPLARLFGCKVICYTHYPTISLDMISRVRGRNLMYNNNAFVAKRYEFHDSIIPQTLLLGISLAGLIIIGELFTLLVQDQPWTMSWEHKIVHASCQIHLPLMVPKSACFHCSIWFSRCKIFYYLLFSWMYGIVGSCAHLVLVNSSWTQSHIEKLWRIPDRTKRVYPPCDTSGLQVCNFSD